MVLFLNLFHMGYFYNLFHTGRGIFSCQKPTVASKLLKTYGGEHICHLCEIRLIASFLQEKRQEKKKKSRVILRIYYTRSTKKEVSQYKLFHNLIDFTVFILSVAKAFIFIIIMRLSRLETHKLFNYFFRIVHTLSSNQVFFLISSTIVMYTEIFSTTGQPTLTLNEISSPPWIKGKVWLL